MLGNFSGAFAPEGNSYSGTAGFAYTWYFSSSADCELQNLASAKYPRQSRSTAQNRSKMAGNGAASAVTKIAK
jgi:hypothetical protein